MSGRGQKTDEPGIYRLEDGRFRVLATAKNPDTNEMEYRQKTMGPEATMADAIKWRDHKKAEIQTPEPSDETKITLREYAMSWIDRKVDEVKPSYAKQLKRVIPEYILPVYVMLDGERTRLGDIPLERMTREHIQQWREWAKQAKKDDGEYFSSGTVGSWWRLLRNLVRDMEAGSYIDSVLTKRLSAPETPRSNVRDKPLLSWYQLRAIADTAEYITPKRYAEVATLCYTGMRTGELWALHWEDVDMATGKIRICRSVSDGTVTDSTKTGRERTVLMRGPMREAIQSHREWLIEVQHPGLRRGLVFPSREGGPRWGGSLSKALENIQEEMNLDQCPNPLLIRKSLITFLENCPDVPGMAITKLVGNTKGVRERNYYKAGPAAQASLNVMEGGEKTG